MARVPYLDANEHPELNDVVARIVGPRIKEWPNGLVKGNHLWKLYGVLLHSPPVADAWAHMMSSIRREITVPPVDQELVITLIAVIHNSRFEFNTHAPKALSYGLTQGQLDALTDWRNSTAYDTRQRALLDYADVMTRQVQVPDEVFNAVRAMFNTRQLVELTALIAAYNFSMRFTVAMEMGE